MGFIYDVYKKFSVDTVAHNYLKKHVDEYIELDDEGIRALQACLLEMLKDIDIACRKSNINYALTGGNVLGKIRHNGFIPWDDDIDLVMMREDYDRFKNEFYKSGLSEKYLLRGPGCKEGADYRCMKIYKMDSVMEQAFPKNTVQKKIFIDVMPFDYVPDNIFHRKLKNLWCTFIIVALGSIDFKENFSSELKNEMKKTFIGRVNIFLRAIIGTLFSIIPLQTWYKLYDRAPIYKKKTEYGTVYNGKLLYFDEIVPVDYYYPFMDCDYCGVETKIIHKPKSYLAFRYGDYMKVPDKSNRETHIVKRIEVGN